MVHLRATKASESEIEIQRELKKRVFYIADTVCSTIINIL